jgi:hypothetical protein
MVCFLIVAFLILLRNVLEFWFVSDCLVLFESGDGLRRLVAGVLRKSLTNFSWIN